MVGLRRSTVTSSKMTSTTGVSFDYRKMADSLEEELDEVEYEVPSPFCAKNQYLTFSPCTFSKKH